MVDSIAQAAERIAQGHLVAFPTETVYGLGARADQDQAVAAIFTAKGRPADHPLIVHIADPVDAAYFAAEIPPVAQRLMAAFWPGPLTIIVKRRPGVASACAGGQDTIGLRCPVHPNARELLSTAKRLGVPGIAAPSANRFGRVSPTTVEHVLEEFGPLLAVVDGGPCGVGIESAIVDCSRGVPVLLRPGSVPRTALAASAGMPIEAPDAASPRASGTLESHYAPTAPVHVWAGEALCEALAQRRRRGREDEGWSPKPLAIYASEGILNRLQDAESQHAGIVATRVFPQTAAAAAQDLFAGLRALDRAVAAGGGEIWVEAPPVSDGWEGVRDRLRRASAGTVHGQRSIGQDVAHGDSDAQ